MKHLLPLLLLVAFVIPLSAQTRDSTAYKTIKAKQLSITINYGGTTDQIIVTPEEVASWIAVRGLSAADSTRPINTALLGHVKAEISRCWAMRDKEKTQALGAIDADDTMTLAALRAAKTAVRLQFMSYLFPYIVQVPAL